MANFTKEAIKRALITLLDDRPLGKITVKDIVEECGINRNTFYYHYDDLPSLLQEIIMEEADKIIRQFPTIDSIVDCLQTVLEDLLQSRKVILNIYNSVNRDVYEFYLMKICEEVTKVYLRQLGAGRTVVPEDRDLLIRFHKACLYGIVVEWIQSGMKESIIGDLDRLSSLLDGYAEALLRRCEQNA